IDECLRRDHCSGIGSYPVALKFEGISRQRHPVTPFVGIETAPIDLNAREVKLCQSGHQEGFVRAIGALGADGVYGPPVKLSVLARPHCYVDTILDRQESFEPTLVHVYLRDLCKPEVGPDSFIDRYRLAANPGATRNPRFLEIGLAQKLQ